MERFCVTLPHGFSENGSLTQKIQLNPMSGHDQRFLAGAAARYPAAARITALLQRLVRVEEGGLPLRAIRKLTAGDCEAILLCLCRDLLGNRISCMICCSQCKEQITGDLIVSDLLVPPAEHPVAEYPVSAAGHRLVIRPVTVGDMEAASNEGSGASESLLRSCIVSAEPPLREGVVPPELAAALSDALAIIDPQAGILLDVKCPICKQAVQIPLEAWDLLQQEIRRRQRHLEDEVHALAFYYHWTEDAILSLPLQRRRRYMELIVGSLMGEGS